MPTTHNMHPQRFPVPPVARKPAIIILEFLQPLHPHPSNCPFIHICVAIDASCPLTLMTILYVWNYIYDTDHAASQPSCRPCQLCFVLLPAISYVVHCTQISDDGSFPSTRTPLFSPNGQFFTGPRLTEIRSAISTASCDKHGRVCTLTRPAYISCQPQGMPLH
jgi:hypothetical protein